MHIETNRVQQKNGSRKRRRVVRLLACFVVFCTTYALILPAITMEQEAFCGHTSHQHSDSCYAMKLICPLEETEGTDGHTHSDACYQTERVLVCEQEEVPADEGHTHQDACYDEEGVLICGEEERPAVEGHTHEDACYEEQTSLICELEEEEATEGHTHTDACYERVLECGLEEHTHSLACYSNPNADLETASSWESGLPKDLTGIWADDLITVAESQLGYEESDQNYEVSGESMKGYTRYGAWYGVPYGDWCAMYISFCLHYAGIPEKAMPYEASCQQWVDKLAGRGIYLDAEDGRPRSGDLVFFENTNDSDRIADHVGIVIKVDEKTGFTTIEGNTYNQVAYRNYDWNDERIMGYGLLPENPDAPVIEQEEEDAEKADDETVTDEKAADAHLSKQIITASGESYEITVTYDESAAIPEGAELKAEEVLPGTEQYQEYLESAAAEIGSDADSVSFARFFDIEILAEGEKVEPAAEVAVQISLADPVTAESLQVVHFEDEGTSVIDAEQVAAEDKDGADLFFQTDGFSTYGIIAQPGSSGVNDLDGYTVKIGIGGRYLLSTVNTSVSPSRIQKGSEADAAEWTFEATGTAGVYNIYTLVDGQKQYMNFGRQDNNNANVTLSGTPQGLTVSTSTNGTYQISATTGGQTYYLNEFSGQNGTGFAGWYNQNDNNARFTFTFTTPEISSGDDQYMVLIKHGGEYYIVLNDGTLQETEWPVNGNVNMVGADTPMFWTYNGSDHLYHPAEAAAFNWQNIASSYRYRYIDPRQDSALLKEEPSDVTLSPRDGSGQIYVTNRALWNAVAIHYDEATHTITSVQDPSMLLKITDEGGKLRLAGGSVDGEVAQVYLAKVADSTLKLGPQYHTVNHIDISVEAATSVNVPLAYGTYYYVENGEVKTLIVNKDNHVTLSLSKDDVDVTGEDLKAGTVTAYKQNADGTQTILPDAFYIDEYSANHETGESTEQVRIGGIFKVADLPPVQNGDGNNDPAIRAARLDPENKIYYSVAATKDVHFNMEYNGHQLYQSAEAATASLAPGYDVANDPEAMTVNSTITLAASFDYWDARNECPGIHALGHTTDWRNGYVFSDSNNYAGNPANSGMDFALGTSASGSTNTAAIEITKYIVDANGNTITPNKEIQQNFHVYRKDINKDATPNPIDEVRNLDVDEYDPDQTQPDYGSGYTLVHDKTVTVGDGGMGLVYDYDIKPGMIYIEEDTSGDNLLKVITDKNGKKWDYTKTYLETEYVWRHDGIEDRFHVSKEYTSEEEAYRSIPDVLGAYRDVNGLDQYNGFLEFYVYNVYESEPTDIPVEKKWKYENGSAAEPPEGAAVDITLGRFKLVEDENNPITGTLLIDQTIAGLPEGYDLQATYSVKRDGITVRTGHYDPALGGAEIKGLPEGTYTVEISSYVEGHDVADSPAVQTVTISQVDISSKTPIHAAFHTVVTDPVPVRTVQVRVTNSLIGARPGDANYRYQDNTYTFVGGSRISVNISRPGPGHNASFHVNITRDGQTVTYTPPQGNHYAGVTQTLLFDLPEQSDHVIQIDITHDWQQQNLWINSVSTVSNAAATNGTSSVNSPGSRMNIRLADTMQAPVLRAAGDTTDQDITEVPDAPPSLVPGMVYVDDTDWDPAATARLSGSNWYKILEGLDAVDENGNRYLYYIKSVHEEGVPEGTVVTIDTDEDGYPQFSTGEYTLSVTNTMPNEPPYVKIRKVDENGYPLVGAKFSISKDGGAAEEIEITSGDGLYTFAGLEPGDYSISETYAPEGYERMAGAITFTVTDDYTLTDMQLPDAVTYSGDTLTFEVENRPVTNPRQITVRKQWLDMFGNVDPDGYEGTLDLKLLQMVPGEPEEHTVNIYFRCTGNGNGGVDFPGQITSITQRSGTGRGDMVIQWDWNQWTQEQPFDVDGLQGSTYTSVWTPEGAQYQPDGRGGRQTLTIRNITQDLTIYILIRNSNYDGTNANLIYQPQFTGTSDAVTSLTPTGGSKTVTLGPDGWSQTFSVSGNGLLEETSETLPATYQNKDCYYAIAEESVPEGYVLQQISSDGALAGVLTAYNKKTSVDVNVIKVDEKNPQVRLNGAEFTLRQIDPYATGSMYSRTLPGGMTDVQTTAGEGEDQGTLTFEGLVPGYYEIKETVIPTGYISEDEAAFYIKVTETGIELLKMDETNAARYWYSVPNTGPVTFSNMTATVTNKPGKELPHTGGTGASLIMLTGCLLIVLAGLLRYRRKSDVISE